MCGISGFSNWNTDYSQHQEHYLTILDNMRRALKHRGPDEDGVYLSSHTGLAHTRLSVIDLNTGRQPITRQFENRTFTIIHNGEIYNMPELRQELIQKGVSFQTTSDAEVLLMGFITYGTDFVKQCNGIFAFAILDESSSALYLFRDRFGIKPLFYTFVEDTLIFASEIKGLLKYPGVTASIHQDGLNEILGLGPAKTYGRGVFHGIYEVKPGTFLTYSPYGILKKEYWSLCAYPHEDSYEQTIAKTRELLLDSVRMQMLSDIPIATFLSGGVDSSIVSAICAAELKKQNKQLTTFSFDFDGNDEFFEANAFQPSRDRPYVEKMVEFLDSNHHYLECDSNVQSELLYDAMCARDLPGMADVDSSLLYFCSVVKDYNRVVLTGECADEIFGGYPWFHKSEFLNSNTFPWTKDLTPRKLMLKDELLETLHMDEYVQQTYYNSIKEAPILPGEPLAELKRRRIGYLNLKWFMQTLLDRMDRTSMHSGLEARVPFADHRLVEYVYNVPWSIQSSQGVVKNLLRESARGLLPDEILFRKKSPYPKTYNPTYENLLRKQFSQILEDSASPILTLIDIEKAKAYLNTPSDYKTPWYGQLMAGPQMLAYYIQINSWLQKYQVQIQI